MLTIQASPGEHITSAAKRLAEAATAKGTAKLTFNDVTVTAKPGDTADAIVARWDAEMERRRVAYINSDDGKAAAKAREDGIAAMQEKHDLLMQDLRSLDWSNDVAVLDWICAMQEPSDCSGVAVRKGEIIGTFAAHGFHPNVNVGNAFNGKDRDNHFRYIVGQALDCLQRVSIHGIVHKFSDDWKRQFLYRK